MSPGTCSIAGCDRPCGRRRGWCERHYDRWRRTGQFEPRRNSQFKTTDQRFWDRVDKSGDSAGCWLWTGHVNDKGYGGVTREDGTRTYAHRLSWELHAGPIPDGMLVDHRCHVRRCVNPEHLRLATPKQNQQNRAGAQSTSKTGVRGVYLRAAGKYIAQAAHHTIGTFDTVEEAQAAVVAYRAQTMPYSPDVDERTTRP